MLFLIRHGKTGFHFVFWSSVELEFIKSAYNELDQFSGAFFEFVDTINFAISSELVSHCLEEAFNPGHKIFLLKTCDFVEFKSINEIDNCDTRAVIFNDVIGSDSNLFNSLGSVASFNFEASSVVDN